MAEIKFSGPGMSDQNVTDDTKTLVENHAVTDDFKFSSGLKWDAYIKAKLVALLGASKKILRVNNANNALEGKTIQEILLEILTTNERMLIRNSSGNIVQSELPDSGFPNYYVAGFGLSSTTSTMTINKGACKDVDNNISMNLTSVFTKTFATWAQGSANGGIWGDLSGLVADKNYYIFIIATPTGNEDIMFMRLETPPSLPTGYNYYRIIGSFATDKNGNIALQTLFNHETYYEHGVNGIPYEPYFTSEIKLEKKDFQTIDIFEMYCRDSTNSLNINIFKNFSITTNTTGSGGNLIDVALLADTQYYIFLATKANGIDTTAYISDSLTPSFPVSYDFTRLIGAFKTEAATTNIDANTLTADEKANGAFEGTFINVQENLAQNTDGGSASTGGFKKRNLTTINKNTIPTAKLNTTAEKITLPRGIYDAHITQAISRIDATGRLYDTTGTVSLLRFTQNDNGNQQGNSLICVGRFELTQLSDIEIQYYAVTSIGTTDLGEPLNIAGLQEQYLQATFIKVK